VTRISITSACVLSGSSKRAKPQTPMHAMHIQQDASAYFRALQDEIVAGLIALDGGAVQEDTWERPGGGGGRSRVISGGSVFEKGGVNVSDVAGQFSADFAPSFPGDGLAFRACGVSLVLHPKNPYIPTVHANFRCIRRGETTWFGGGADLTPYYVFSEDAVHFHRSFKAACDVHDGGFYGRFKPWCDRYFFLKHRQEPRGIGGIFFDYLGAGAESVVGQPAVPASPVEGDLEKVFAFVKDAGAAFLKAYAPIVERRRGLTFSDRERDWQLHRRGRYVEFNLVYDRGTVFGLKTDGRTESILMSLPPDVKWTYGYTPEPGSPEAASLEEICAARDWAQLPG